MRLLAVMLFTCAAFAIPFPWMDRAGTVAGGLACLALALPRKVRVKPSALTSRPSSRLRPFAGEDELVGSEAFADFGARE